MKTCPLPRFPVLSILVAIAALAGTAEAVEHLVTQPVLRESCSPDPTILGASLWDDRVGQTFSGATLRGGSRQALLRAGTTGVCPNPDNLNSMAVGSVFPYDRVDQTELVSLWQAVVGCAECSPAPRGVATLWMGSCNPAWESKIGYPNNTYQILYIDTGTHAANYTLRLDYIMTAEYGYDFLYLIGGGGNSPQDPAGCNRAILDQAIAEFGGGVPGEPTLLASWTGSVTPTIPNAFNINTLSGPVEVVGYRDQQPQTILAAQIQIEAQHRALYFVFKSDERFSNEDGLWCYGRGIALDEISTSDHGLIYSEEASAGLTGGPPCNERVLVGTVANPIVSARVPLPVGPLWAITSGLIAPTSDLCAPTRDLPSERFFFGGDPVVQMLVPGQHNSVVGCPFAVPAGTAKVIASWNEYMDLPRGHGFVRFAEMRTYHGGAWSRWRNASMGDGVHRGAALGWRTEIQELAECEIADSAQVRYTVQCVPRFAVDLANCQPVRLGLLVDDFKIQFMSGTASPTFGVFPGSVAQSTFVDGTMTGVNCAVSPCWPGVRGTALGLADGGIDDNVNSALGDSMTVSIRVSALAGSINWHQAFDKCVDGGRTIAHTNHAYSAVFDVPRLIFRLYDPMTKSWGPFDSSALDVDALSISAGCGSPLDSAVTSCTFRWDWPPRDKLDLNANLPGGFTVNGMAAYAQLAFLPHGTRLQYYYKGVSTNGVVAYQFRSDQPSYEIADLPILPSSTARAPDIMQFEVLPGVYPAGSAGSLLSGATSTPVLNLDAAYTTWGFGQDPVTYALRGLGVRADRYRLLQGLEEGNNVGGAMGFQRMSNFFPNQFDYAIRDSLAAWYRILIVSSHGRVSTVLEEQDARLLSEWWLTDTGMNGGDRCILANGNDFFNSLFNAPPPLLNQITLSQQVFGVNTAIRAWSGTNSNQYPAINDLFSGQTYILDGGCPNLGQFDGLVKVGSASAANAALYPSGTEVAGVAQSSEQDVVPDVDRNKALGYAYSIQFIRRAGAAPEKPGACCAYGGLPERLRLLYAFLTSCRGARSTATQCWPCPADMSDAALTGNWATNAGFQTATYGPLYPIQDHLIATAVGEELTPHGAPFANSISQNRPNPFNPETVIPYSLAAPGRVAIRIYDIVGRCVRTLIDRHEAAGPHVARWRGETETGEKAASGVYFYRITYPDGEVSGRKMILLR